MSKAVVWLIKILCLAGLVYVGMTIPNLIQNSKLHEAAALTENGISINAAAPPLRALPVEGQSTTTHW